MTGCSRISFWAKAIIWVRRELSRVLVPKTFQPPQKNLSSYRTHNPMKTLDRLVFIRLCPVVRQSVCLRGWSQAGWSNHLPLTQNPVSSGKAWKHCENLLLLLFSSVLSTLYSLHTDIFLATPLLLQQCRFPHCLTSKGISNLILHNVLSETE